MPKEVLGESLLISQGKIYCLNKTKPLNNERIFEKMKKIISLLLLISIMAMTISLMSCSNQSNNSTESQTTEQQTEAIALTVDNFHDYFDVSIEYYNFSSEELGGKTVLGVYVPKYYESTVSQRVKITPKSNVVSCDNVKLKFCGCAIVWSYSESTENWYREINLSSDGKYDSSVNLYLYNKSNPATCPVPKSMLNFNAQSYVNGTITITK